jgi:hypothetical protein
MAVAFSIVLEGSKSDNLTKTRQNPKLPQNLRLISLLSTTGELFENSSKDTLRKITY